MKELKHIVLLSLLMPIVGFAQSTQNQSSNFKARIDSLYRAEMKANKVVGVSIAIVDNHEIAYAQGYGFADLESRIPVTPETSFRVGSITKSFTAIAIMQLNEKGLLNLDEPITTYLPELKTNELSPNATPITLRHLLSHTSGLPSEFYNGFLCDAPPQGDWLMEQLNQQKKLYPANFKHIYSNLGYALLGEVIARVSKQPYAEYIRQHIFQPLHMASGYIHAPGQTKAPSIAKGYHGMKPAIEPYIRDQAAGSICASADDMAQFISMWLQNGSYSGSQLVTQNSVSEMQRNQLSTILLKEKNEWGLGLQIKKYQVQNQVINAWGHPGDTFAFHADYAFIPELQIGVVVLTNSSSGQEMNAAEKLLRLYLSSEYKKELRKAAPPLLPLETWERSGSWNDIQGDYLNSRFVMRITQPDKIKVRQGVASLILSRKQNFSYSVNAQLLGFIRFPIRDMGVQFVKVNEYTLLKLIQKDENEFSYQSLKQPASSKITLAWKNRLGNYSIMPGFFACNQCTYGDLSKLKMTLSEDNGYLKIQFSNAPFSRTNFLSVVNDSLAITSGVDRDSGMNLTALEDGTLAFSGLRFQKK
ncbi:MAG: beta-lactamase family protein [Cyclobacteriaceae bacterium]|nr:beta-lactamase family protein [Cyclobacteriaceae bacterium]